MKRGITDLVFAQNKQSDDKITALLTITQQQSLY